MLDLLVSLNLVHGMIIELVRDTESNLAKELHESTVRVESKALVIGEVTKALNSVGIKTKVEDGVHHTGHGHGGTRTK